MPVMIVKHKVADFKQWKVVFDSMNEVRRQHGWTALFRLGIRRPSPDGALVHLNALVGNASKDHRSKPAIAERQCFRPLCRRLAIP